MNDKIVPFRQPASALEPFFEMQRAWFDTSAEMMRSLAGISARDVQINTGDITINYPFAQGLTLFMQPMQHWLDMMASPDAEGEKRVVTEVASYGAQLEKVMELLIPLAEDSEKVSADDVEALKDLKARIDSAKNR